MHSSSAQRSRQTDLSVPAAFQLGARLNLRQQHWKLGRVWPKQSGKERQTIHAGPNRNSNAGMQQPDCDKASASKSANQDRSNNLVLLTGAELDDDRARDLERPGESDGGEALGARAERRHLKEDEGRGHST